MDYSVNNKTANIFREVAKNINSENAKNEEEGNNSSIMSYSITQQNVGDDNYVDSFILTDSNNENLEVNLSEYFDLTLSSDEFEELLDKTFVFNPNDAENILVETGETAYTAGTGKTVVDILNESAPEGVSYTAASYGVSEYTLKNFFADRQDEQNWQFINEEGSEPYYVRKNEDGSTEFIKTVLQQNTAGETESKIVHTKSVQGSDELDVKIYDMVSATNEQAINGEIDGFFIQGTAGDCWLLATLNSLNSTEAGKEAISNLITINADGNYAVKFPGTEELVTVTQEELANTTGLSIGDKDVKLLEIAVSKTQNRLFQGKQLGQNDTLGRLWAGHTQDVVKLLFDSTASTLATPLSNASLEKWVDAMWTNGFHTISFTDAGNMKVALADGSTKEISNGATSVVGHMWSITGYDKESNLISIVDPTRPGNTEYITPEELRKLNGYIESYIIA